MECGREAAAFSSFPYVELSVSAAGKAESLLPPKAQRIRWTNDGMPVVGEKDPGGGQKPILFPHPRQRVGQRV